MQSVCTLVPEEFEQRVVAARVQMAEEPSIGGYRVSRPSQRCGPDLTPNEIDPKNASPLLLTRSNAWCRRPRHAPEGDPVRQSGLGRNQEPEPFVVAQIVGCGRIEESG